MAPPTGAPKLHSFFRGGGQKFSIRRKSNREANAGQLAHDPPVRRVSKHNRLRTAAGKQSAIGRKGQRMTRISKMIPVELPYLFSRHDVPEVRHAVETRRGHEPA